MHLAGYEKWHSLGNTARPWLSLPLPLQHRRHPRRQTVKAFPMRPHVQPLKHRARQDQARSHPCPAGPRGS
jgi:hypothetical protein